MTVETTTIPGFRAGTWTIDPVHSEVSFTARHLGVAKVRGTFDAVEATIMTAEDPRQSSVIATIRTTSVNTRNGQRDGHLRSADFLDVDRFPTMTFRSTAIRPQDDGHFLVDGELTLRGVTKPVTLEVEDSCFAEGPQGSLAGFSASTEISRTDFDVTGGPAGAVVGDKIRVGLEIEATLTA
jgi:polyisoprenoid-binding protein YceI